MKAAFSKINITPELPVRLSGFGVNRVAHEVLDPVYARIHYFQGNHEFLWIQFDLCGVDNELIDLVKEKTQIQDCLLSATHTHSGPCGTLNTKNGSLKGLDAVFGFYNEEYVEWISDCIRNEVEKCRNQVEDVKVRISKGQVKNLGSDRHDDSYGDDDCLCLELKTSSSNVMIVRLACHPTVMNASNLMMSADFCGEIEKNFEFDMVSYVNGSCGDISTRFTRLGNGKEEKERLGKAVADQIKEFLNQNDYENLELKYVHKIFDLETREVDSMEVAYSKLEIAKANLQKAIDEGKSDKEIRVMESFVEGAQNNLLSASSLGNVKSLPVSVSLLKVNDQVIVFTPVELFSKLSNPIKEKMGYEFVGYTNGYLLYMPNEIAYDLNYYESFSSPFKKGVAEKFMEEICNVKI